MNQKLNALAIGYTSAILAAAGVLLLGIAGNFGIYTGAAEQMTRWHMFFDLSLIGIVAGTIEAALICFIIGYVFAGLYNKLAK